MQERKIVSRLGMFDLAKGIGMIIVVLSHILGYYNLQLTGVTIFYPFWYIGCGLMPMFFIISGYGMRKRPIGRCLKQQARYYIYPYIYTGIVTVIVYGVMHYITFGYKDGAIYEMKNMTMSFLCGISTPQTTFMGYEFHKGVVAIWFFLAMFIGWNIVNAVMFIRNSKVAFAIITACVLAGYGCTLIGTLPFCISQGLISTGYIYAGYIMKKRKIFEKNLGKGVIFIFLVLTIISSIVGYPEMAYNDWKLGPYDIVCAGIIGYMVIKACFVIDSKFRNNKIINGIKVIGRYTYWIMIIHCFEIMVYHWDMLGTFPVQIDLLCNSQLLRFIVQTVICILIIIAGCAAFNIKNSLKAKRR